MNKAKNVSVKEEQRSQFEEAEKQGKLVVHKITHQVIALTIIHLLYIVFEAYNAFNESWVSAIIYGVIALGTVGFIWLQKDNAKYLIPIPFISLCVIGGILENTIVITTIFGAYCIFFYTLLFFERKTTETLVTNLFSALTLLILTSFMLFDQGFVKVDYIVNVVSGIWLLWGIIVSAVTIRHKDNFGIRLGYSIVLTLLCSVGPFIKPEGMPNSNLFTLTCGILFLMVAIISVVLFFTEEFNMGKFFGVIAPILASIVIFSYSFAYNFTWISSILNKAFIVDYALFIPLALFTMIIIIMRFYEKPDTEELRTLSDERRKKKINNDMILFGIFIGFIIASMVMLATNWKFNCIKGLVVSIAFLGATIPLNIRVTTTSSLVSTFLFLGLVLSNVEKLQTKYIYIILLAISSTILLFAIVNELFLLGEPLTTTLSIVSALVGMVTSILYFYSEDVPFKVIWTSISWAIIGIILFAYGIIFNKIFLRRSGLAIILFDIVYSIITISITYRGWQMGVAFIILAMVLMGCIYLFRWSEKKTSTEEEQETILE